MDRTRKQLPKHCPMEACTADGVRMGSRAQSASTVATWTVVGGVAALGTAALLLLWPAAPAPTGKTARTEAREGLLANARLGGLFGGDGSAHLVVEGTF